VADDRREILKIYDQKMKLQMTADALEYAVRRTGEGYMTQTGTSFSGDHLNALCRSVARIRLRDKRTDATQPNDVERGLTEYDERLELTPREEKLLATHEAGHAVVSLFCTNRPPIERITIRSETSWAPAYVRYQEDSSRRIGLTRNQILDDLSVLYGGIEAERLLLDDVSTGAAGSDLERATRLAHFLVELGGMGGADIGLRQFSALDSGQRLRGLSEEQLAVLDREINQVILEARQRAAQILRENRTLLESMRELLLEKKTLDAQSLAQMRTANGAQDLHKG
jgi:cell division protease FtsH